MTQEAGTAQAASAPDTTEQTAPWARPALALAAGLLGLATAHAAGVTLNLAYAAGSLVLSLTAFAGFTRMTTRVAPALPGTLLHALLTLVGPAAFLLLLVLGSDYAQRGTLAWPPFAAALSFALLAACLPLSEQFARRAHDQARGHASLAVALAPAQAKLAYLGLALPAYVWLILQVGRYTLPQGCAAAAITVLLSFHAARILHEQDDEDADDLVRAVRFTAIAALLHALLLAAALVFDTR